MGIHLQPKLVEVAEDLSAGVLLSQIVYWFSPDETGHIRAYIERNGKNWWVTERKEIQEVCGLSEWQTRKALALLEKRGIISTEIHKFGRCNRTFIHLHVGVLADDLRRKANGEPLHSQTENLSIREVRNPPFPYKEISVENSEETFAPTSGATDTPPSTCTTPVGVVDTDSYKVVEGKTGNLMATVSEILRHKREESKGPNGNGVRALSILWKRRMGTLYGGFQKDLTQSEVGQLRQFAIKCGTVAGEALDWALQNWDTVAFETRQRYGLSAAPERPVVGFVLKYHDVVVDLLQSSAQAATKLNAVEDKPTAPPIASPQIPKQEKKKDVVSLEHVKAAMAKLKSG